MQVVGNCRRNGAGAYKISFAIQSAVSCDCSVIGDCSAIGDYSAIGDCSAIGEGHAVLHGQGGVFRYGQRFARFNLQILLKRLVSIDFAIISVEDNAAPTALIALIADAPIGNNQGMTGPFRL